MRLIPNWLQGMIAPTICLWCCVTVVALGSTLAFEESAPAADLASRFTLPFIMAWWIVEDARKRGRKLCYDFDSFVFFVWPLVVPIYLFQTRGARAFLTFLCFAAMGIGGAALGAAIVVLQKLLE